MKVAGIYPTEKSKDPKIQHAIDEPYGLEKILAVAKSQGHEVRLFLPDRDGQNEAIINEITAYNPDVAAFSLYTCQYPEGKAIAQQLKKQNSGIVNVAGNRYPTHLKDHVEGPFDFFVVKEGEETFKELLYELQNGRNFENVKGIAFNRDGKITFTGVRPRNLDLDSIPNALRFEEVMAQPYKGISIPPLSSNPRYAIMEYSRCCYNRCKFCDNEGFWGNKIVFRSPQKVVEEMFELKEKGVSIFYFMDLNFTSEPEKARQLCKEMTQQNLGASWYCMSNTLTANNPELLALMKQSGCYKIAWGIESTSDSSLKKMDKKVGNRLTRTEETNKVLNQALESGILNQGFYIIGFPWETEESIEKDSEHLKDVPMHQLNIGIFTPIPMSRFYDEVIAEGYTLNPNLRRHDRNHLIYSHKSLTNEAIKGLQQKIHSRFYNSPEYQARIQKSIAIEPRFERAFSDYSEFLQNMSEAA